jgi:hypothetical protein
MMHGVGNVCRDWIRSVIGQRYPFVAGLDYSYTDRLLRCVVYRLKTGTLLLGILPTVLNTY